MDNHKIVALIPARIGSKRLPEKNIRLINNRPMVSYAINACKKSGLIEKVYVSTESEKIGAIAQSYGAAVIDRPEELAEDNVSTQRVIQHFASVVSDFDIVVSMQANSPGVKPENIDKAIKLLIDNNLWEVRSVDSRGLEHGAIWVLKRDTIFWNGLSVYFGVITDDTPDIHTDDDLKNAEKYLNEN